MRLDSVGGELPENIVNELINIEKKIQEILQEEAANRITVNQLFTKQQKYFEKNDAKLMDELFEEQNKLISKISVAMVCLDETFKTCLLNYYTLRSMKGMEKK